VFTLVKTNGDFVLARTVEAAANEAARSGVLPPEHVRRYIGEVFASISFWVDSLSLVIQGLAVSRIVKRFGFGVAFCTLPFLAFADAVLMATWPVLAAVRVGKTRNMLWLTTSRQAKYLAKQATDTFFVRAGDVSSAGLIFVTAQLSLPLWAIPVSNVALVVVWLLLARAILRRVSSSGQARRTLSSVRQGTRPGHRPAWPGDLPAAEPNRNAGRSGVPRPTEGPPCDSRP
jgi:AAA family ATP:ADP antiporter